MSSNFWLPEWWDFLLAWLDDAAAFLIKCLTRLLFLTLLAPSLLDSSDEDDEEDSVDSETDESSLFESSSDESWFEEDRVEDRSLDDEDLADDWDDERSASLSEIPLDFLDVDGVVITRLGFVFY